MRTRSSVATLLTSASLIAALSAPAWIGCGGGFSAPPAGNDASTADAGRDVIPTYAPESGGVDAITLYAPDSRADDANAGDAITDAPADGVLEAQTDGASDAQADVATGADAGPTCVIAGTTYASGAVNPANACQTCQPGVIRSAWSNVGDGTSCGSATTCQAGVCGVACTKVVTSTIGEVYTGSAITVSYQMVGGGGGGSARTCDFTTVGGGGGGGGGSSAILVSETLQADGAGGMQDTAAVPVSGSFGLPDGANVTVYVGGGGGGGGGGLGGGGGGGSGYFGGGGGGGNGCAANIGNLAGGGSTVGGAGGISYGTETLNPEDVKIGGTNGMSGGSLVGGAGGNFIYPGAGGGSSSAGGSESYMGGGGGGFGGGGGAGSQGDTFGLGGGGSNGADGIGVGNEGDAGASSNPFGIGGLGANTWAASTTLPAAAGAAGAAVADGMVGNGGNAGLVILTYFQPGGTCGL